MLIVTASLPPSKNTTDCSVKLLWTSIRIEELDVEYPQTSSQLQVLIYMYILKYLEAHILSVAKPQDRTVKGKKTEECIHQLEDHLHRGLLQESGPAEAS